MVPASELTVFNGNWKKASKGKGQRAKAKAKGSKMICLSSTVSDRGANPQDYLLSLSLLTEPADLDPNRPKSRSFIRYRFFAFFLDHYWDPILDTTLYPTHFSSLP